MKATRKLAVVLALIAAALVLGSGAFTALTVDRSASINVAGDDSALLSITPHSSASSQNVFQDDGTLKIQVSQSTTTTYDKLFVITNQGTQTVGVWVVDIDHTGGGTSGDLQGDIIGNLDEDNTANVTFFNTSFGGAATCENGVKSLESEGNAVDVPPGANLVVGLLADADSVSGEEADLLDEMIIHADASVDGHDMTTTTGPCP